MNRSGHPARWFIAPSGWALLQLLLAAFAVALALGAGVARFDLMQLLPNAIRVGVALSCILIICARTDAARSVWSARLVALLGGIAFLETGWVLVRLLNHLTMVSAFPLADQKLAAWDAMLGLDWRSWFEVVSAHGWLRDLLGASYTSLTIFSVLAFLAMTLFGDARRGRYFLEVFLATALLSTIWGAFLPANGAVDHYLGSAHDLSAFRLEPGRFFLTALAALREGEPVALQLKALPGLVTFPSFHTAAGVLLVGAAWRSWMFVPALFYAAVMIASTPVFGGHYFVDLIAGSGLALAILAGYAALPRYRGLFARCPAADLARMEPARS